MSSPEREEPDRDPAVARKTTRPCAIEDGEERTSAWRRLSARLTRRRRPAAGPQSGPPEPDTLPEAPPPGGFPEETE
jgi:hypothetical protein